MAIPSNRSLALAMLMIIGISLISDHLCVSAQSCGDISGLVSKCLIFVTKLGPKIPPSPDCCGVLKGSDIPCACKHVTKEIETFVSMEKVVYIAQTCGISVPHGMKCGSKAIISTFLNICLNSSQLNAKSTHLVLFIYFFVEFFYFYFLVGVGGSIQWEPSHRA